MTKGFFMKALVTKSSSRGTCPMIAKSVVRNGPKKLYSGLSDKTALL